MDALHLPVTMGEYVTFHAMDRALYSVLAVDLWCDPFESLYILALWVWMERQGFKNFILYLLSLDISMLQELADEAIKCLRGIKDIQFVSQAEVDGIPMLLPQTYRILKDKISPQYFLQNRNTIMREIMTIVSEVGTKVFPDHIEDAHNMHVAYNLWAIDLSSLGITSETPQITQYIAQSKEERTMFITFSRGYPVTEEEVRTVFTTFYGDCIESFHMQPVNPYQQPLYARIVLNSPSIVMNILNGGTKAKFSVNGKHIWVRKFMSKHNTTFP